MSIKITYSSLVTVVIHPLFFYHLFGH